MSSTKSYLIILSIVVAGLALLVSNAHGQQPTFCAQYTDIQNNLYEKYSEVPVDMYVRDNGYALVIFFNEETESWTIYSVAPNGLSCEAASGNGYTNSFPDAPGAEGSDS